MRWGRQTTERPFSTLQAAVLLHDVAEDVKALKEAKEKAQEHSEVRSPGEGGGDPHLADESPLPTRRFSSPLHHQFSDT